MPHVETSTEPPITHQQVKDPQQVEEAVARAPEATFVLEPLDVSGDKPPIIDQNHLTDHLKEFATFEFDANAN